jgi:cell wall-associated NlpC family hydrolase
MAGLSLGSVAAVLFGLSKVHNSNGTNWLQQGPGGSGSGWNSWGALGHNISNWVSDLSPNPAMHGGQATSVPQAAGGSPGAVTGGANSIATKAIAEARGELGTPYHLGMEEPHVGFDCSGLVQWSYKEAGLSLPRTSQEQWAALKNRSVPLNKLQPGDIVFQAGSDGTTSAPGHEGLYIGGGQVIQAPHTGTNVMVSPLAGGGWTSAARPTGSAGSVSTSGSGASASVAGTNIGYTGSALVAGNSGDADLGLTTNADSMLFSGGAATLDTLTSVSMSQQAQNASPSTSGGSGAVSVPANASQSAWIGQLFKALGVPNSKANMSSLTDWMAHEEPPSDWSHWNNPMNTTMPEAGAVSENSDGVKSYKTLSQGLAATVATLQNGLYPQILAQLKAGKGLLSGASADLLKWSGGGYSAVETGGTIIVGERGPEAVTIPNGSAANVLNAKQTSQLLRGQTARPAQAPWALTPAQQLVLDNVPQNAVHQAGGGGVTNSVNFAQGSIVIGGASSSQFSGTLSGSDINTVTQQFQQAVEQALTKIQLNAAVRQGDT